MINTGLQMCLLAVAPVHYVLQALSLTLRINYLCGKEREHEQQGATGKAPAEQGAQCGAQS